MSERRKKEIRNWRCGSTILFFVKDPEKDGYFAFQVYAGDSGALEDLGAALLGRQRHPLDSMVWADLQCV
jgi:hypothetical protein